MRIAGIGRYGAFSNARKSHAVLSPNQRDSTPATPQNHPHYSSAALWCLALAGILLRVLRYAQGRSLWLDEIFLANNLQHKSALQSLGPLDYRQGAPPLFLLFCKLSINLFGNSEYVLRLVPLLAGIAGVYLFTLLARKFLSIRAALAAVALFSLLEPLVYYSSETKQYSTDVLVTIGIMWAIAKFASQTKVPSQNSRLALLLVGILAIFSSHPALFVLAGASVWLLQSKRYNLSALLPIFLAWGIAFFADYFLFLKPLEANNGLQHHWAAAYPPMSIGIFPWLWQACKALFAGYDTMWLNFKLVGLWPAYAAMILAPLGCRNLYRRGILGLAGWPIVFTLAAALLRKYPFDDRLILFLVPLIVLMIAGAVEKFRRGIPAILFVFVLLPCLARETIFAMHPPGREEIQTVMAYLKNHWQSGDTLYLYHPADTGYLYYRDQAALSDVRSIDGQWHSGDSAAFADDWRQLTGHKRVWILFSHVLPTPNGDERQEFLDLLRKQYSVQIQNFQATGASVYLFDTTNH